MAAADPQVRIETLEVALRAASRELHWANLTIQKKDAEIQLLQQRLRQQRIGFLGPASETLSDLQLELLIEEEPGATREEVEAESQREPISTAPARKRKPHPGRKPLPESLPRVEEVIACEANCTHCGGETRVIGYDWSEVLDREPAKWFVRVTKREKRSCGKCSAIQMPPLAPRIVEKGLASDRVIMETVVAKYCDHLPLYRQEAMLEREAGVEISRATLDGWVMRVGELLQPVAEAMREELLRGSYLQADETIVPVQMHDGRGSDHPAYLWQYGTPGGETVFDFQLGRGRDGPREIPQRLERDFTNRRLSGLRPGGRTRSDSRGLLGARTAKVRRRGESKSEGRRGHRDGHAHGCIVSGGSPCTRATVERGGARGFAPRACANLGGRDSFRVREVASATTAEKRAG